MSHFTVIVIGENVDEQMEPYAEQDYDEKYAAFSDEEDTYLNEYENEDIAVIVLKDGTVHHKYSEIFRNRGFRSMGSDYTYPEDSSIRGGSFKEIFPTFEEFMKEWHGQSERDSKMNRYGYWHNPNAKWDWYTVGGRWTGYFKPKAGATGEIGESGSFGNKPTKGYVDVIKVGDIDIKAMRKNVKKEANKTYDKLEEILGGRPIPSWNAVVKKHGENYDNARAEYNSMQTVLDLNKAGFFSMGDLTEVFGSSREEYVEKEVKSIIVPYAFVKEGKWYEKGEMGWFGMSNDKMTQAQWNEQFWQMMDTLSPDTKLTLIDCHI